MGYSHLSHSRRQLGIRDIATQSKAHLTQLVWRFITEPNSYWGSILTQKYLRFGNFRNRNQTPKDSSLWRKMLALKHNIFYHMRWSVGNGVQIDAIQDLWIPGNDPSQPHSHRLPPHEPSYIHRVCDLVIEDQNNRPCWDKQLLSH